ncbi:flagellar hook capping protein [Sphingomonas sp. Leaf33]|uniref:flagellar hook assembly protein FlgD n=1 Tax=Sphingomonas sp. Leaf33 TaxID=1736215 RepID=UPI0006FFED25|nr:flagellar hook capping FlgD N-terminal domain-containing protein [Sphingomonas sp. Leaf33]KQN21420.1 flagellar hook capping protein [Sphingomonas sp. Leaf33]
MQATPASPITSTQVQPPAADASTGQAAASAFGLGFDALLKIILTQLTYQDPLKPMDNFEFVSQLAQFSQVQQGQASNDRLQALVSVQATNQATGLLGKRVDIPAGAATLSGTVTAIALSNGTPTLTIETDYKRTVSGIAIGSIAQVREKK